MQDAEVSEWERESTGERYRHPDTDPFGAPRRDYPRRCP